MVCTRSECKSDLHCFQPKYLDSTIPSGAVGNAGSNSSTLHRRSNSSRENGYTTFSFNVPLTPGIEACARRHGSRGLINVARHQLGKERMLHFNESGTVRAKQKFWPHD